MNFHIKSTLLLVVALAATTIGCSAQPTPPVEYSLPELKYRLIASFDDVFWCDPYLWPVARPDQEHADALTQFPAIMADTAEFSAITQHLGLLTGDYTDADKVLIFREHRELQIAVQTDEAQNPYQFTIRVREGQGERIEGTITRSGTIKITGREPSINTCPICLSAGTLIDTPRGFVPVEQLDEGMAIWTSAGSGSRIVGTVVKTVQSPVPPSFPLLKITLSDGRSVTASSGHPTAENKMLGEYRKGNLLDGALVMKVEFIAYDRLATYDILPSGDTGLYWANDILLKSTLSH